MRAHRLGRLGAFGARGPGVLTAVAALVGALALVAAVPGAPAANLQLVVTFNANHTISVTLPDGTPVGTTSGQPTVIPAGFYTLTLDDSAVVAGPQFDLQGPGVSLVDNMFYGETASATDTADLAPSSTYTWRDDENPSVVYTFMTSAVVAGGPATPSATGSTSSTGGGASSGGSSSQDIVGSAVHAPAKFRGTLLAGVSTAGKLTLSDDGKTVTILTAGRYTISVTDKSAKSGFTIQETRKTATVLTGSSFVGKRSVTLDLTAGQWFFYPSFIGKKTYFLVIS